MIVLYVLGGILGALLGLILLFLLVLLISVLFVDTKKEYNKRSNYFERLTDLLAWVLLKLCNVKVSVTGLEKIPEKGRFLLVSNHRSMFDVVTTRWVLRKYDIAYVSKPENFKIPVAKQLAKKCRFLSIDRENPKNAMKTLVKAIDFIKKDEGSICIYPEGTRSKDGAMLPFHDGVFKIAQKADVPVLVAALVGTEKVSKNAPFKRTRVYIDFLDCFRAEQNENSHDLSEKSRALIEQQLILREGEKHLPALDETIVES